MHRKTFEAKLAAYRAAYEALEAALDAFCTRQRQRLDQIEAQLSNESHEDGA